MKVIAVADSDSYLKWSLATLRRLPPRHTSTQLVIDSPVRPSARQREAAGHDRLEPLGYGALLRRIEADRPDVVLLAGTGPVVAALTDHRMFRRPDRPVLVSGLPGISIPATSRAVSARAGCDLLVLHSHREIAAFTPLAAQAAPELRLGLARLPFLPTAPAGHPSTDGSTIIFAAQARVPPGRGQREEVLRALAATEGAVVKLRAGDREQQTHREQWPYPLVMDDLVRRGRLAAGSVPFVHGSMHDALAGAFALATVSSTAALEAVALGLPILVLADFGVSAEMINLMFADSGCLGTLDDLVHRRFHTPDPRWLAANYLHDPRDDDWLERLDELLAVRAAGGLRAPRVTAPWRTRVRRRLRLLPGARSRRASPGRDRTARGRPLRRRPG